MSLTLNDSIATYDATLSRPRPAPPRMNRRPANLTEGQRFERYLAQLHRAPVGLSEAHADSVRTLWADLRARFSRALPLPAAGRMDETFVLTWSTPSVLVELEVGSDGRLHWYASERHAARGEGSESAQEAFPEAVYVWLERAGARRPN